MTYCDVMPPAPPFPVTMPGVLEVWRQKENISPSDYAEKYRSVTIGSHRGSWDNDVTPYLREIMDAGGQPFVEEVVICGPPQSGKTNACINILLWHIYRFGGNGKFIMFPTELLAKLFYRVRLVPILQGCPPLAGRISKEPKDTTSEKVSLRDGTHLFPAWGSSAAKLSSFPADFIWADEIDKNNELTGDETDPLSLLEDRVRTARRRISLKCSTPTVENGHIWRSLNKCQMVFERYVTCPHCQAEQLMDKEHITWPGQLGLFEAGDTASQPDFEPELLKSMRIARYACPHCGSLWDDLERNQAVRAGLWRNKQGQTPEEAYTTRPRSLGFHITGYICPDISLSDIAAEIIKARTGDIAAERRRDNSFLGIPWIEKTGEAPELTALIERAEAYAPIVPMGAALLTAGVDVQADRLEIEVVAWGVGAESWGMEYAVLYGDTRLPQVWEQLDGYLLREWEHSCGERLRIARAFVDGGYIPNTVARFCHGKKARGVYMIKGSSTHDAPEVQGPVKQKHGGYLVEVFNLGGNKLKTQMFAYFGLKEPGHGYCHIPETYPAKWFEMLQAEHVVEKKTGSRTVMVWEKKPGCSRNESIDLRQYALAALMSMRVDIKGILSGMKARVEEQNKTAVYQPRKQGYVSRWK